MLHRILQFDCVPSTNTIALEAREEGLVVLAREQSAGRGQRGHTWASARDLGLWCSICLEMPPEGLNFALACAIHAALTRRVDVQLKWPNDILWRNCKICGLLVEHRNGWSALGFGINLHHRPGDFPPELRETAASLDMTDTGPWERQALLDAVIEELAPRIAALRAGSLAEIHREWTDRLGLLGQPIRRGEIAGKVVAIALDGTLNIETLDSVVCVSSGGVVRTEERVSGAAGH